MRRRRGGTRGDRESRRPEGGPPGQRGARGAERGASRPGIQRATERAHLGKRKGMRGVSKARSRPSSLALPRNRRASAPAAPPRARGRGGRGGTRGSTSPARRMAYRPGIPGRSGQRSALFRARASSAPPRSRSSAARAPAAPPPERAAAPRHLRQLKRSNVDAPISDLLSGSEAPNGSFRPQRESAERRREGEAGRNRAHRGSFFFFVAVSEARGSFSTQLQACFREQYRDGGLGRVRA